MKPRRPRRTRRKDRQSWAAQHWRLQEIAEGRLEPHFEHEVLFRWTLDHRGVANPHAFILPAMLFLAATVTRPLPRSLSEGPAPAAPGTAPSRPGLPGTAGGDRDLLTRAVVPSPPSA
ncbi:hypothetical protein [Brevundimonas sp.]|uniref:hypothetical protein n=1 Tax=Brevundimonas sp. TaxID=1871086 RepID=UPI002D6C9363|nr:hypothetical protein [Brevundimonas sp.]HYD28811.1 hypothetical protein [Brevundimonas sp.]